MHAAGAQGGQALAMASEALTQRDQAWIDLFGTTLAAKLSPPQPDTAPEKGLKAALKEAAPGSTIKWEGFDIVLPVEAEAAAKTAGAGKAPHYEAKGKTKASVDGEPAEAEVEAAAKLLAPIEQPLSGLKLGGIEVGKLGLGLGLGLIATETLNGVISPIKLDAAGQPELNAEGNTQVNWANVGAKYGLAGAFALAGPNFMGRDATIGAVAYPLAQALGDTIPFDRVVHWIVSKFKGGDEAGAEQRLSARQRQQLAAARNRFHQDQAAGAGMRSTTIYDSLNGAFTR